jgi:DNA-binding SARP family transcriptional activator
MIANLELRFLGGLHILLDDVPLTPTMSSKGKALLCYLSVTGKEHSRSALAGLLWTDIPETNARANLRKTLSRIKPHLGPHLTITRETIAFNPDAPHWLDVTDFEAGVKPGSDFIRLQEAVSLYQGDFLESFYLPDAPLFDEWVLSQRAWLRGAVLNGFQALVTHFTHEGEYETAISHARRLLNIEPWHEGAHRELMGLLALSGQRSAALMQYETCRRILAEDLGVEPAPATVTLYDQIRQGKFDETKRPDQGAAVGSVVDAQITPQHTSLHHNLPAQTTTFIGRETELVELERLLTDPTIRLVTICGAGGMGKTRLAIEAALAQLEYFNQGVYFVPLESLEDPDQIVGTIAEIFGYSFHEGDDPQQQLLDYLRPKTLLLVMDNFERLVAQARLRCRDNRC